MTRTTTTTHNNRPQSDGNAVDAPVRVSCVAVLDTAAALAEVTVPAVAESD